jgi:hypothetical protein
MKRKGLLLLVLATLVAGGAFAQKVGDTLDAFGKKYTVKEVKDGNVLLQPALTLDGVWKMADVNIVITISGNNGVLTSISNVSAGYMDAYKKGYINQWWRNLKSAGSLKWTGQQAWVQAYNDNPNVSSGVSWPNVTLVMSTDGNTLTVSEKNANGTDKWTHTYKRQ